MKTLIIDREELKWQLTSILESDMNQNLKEGLHNFLGEILDNTTEGKSIKVKGN